MDCRYKLCLAQVIRKEKEEWVLVLKYPCGKRNRWLLSTGGPGTSDVYKRCSQKRDDLPACSEFWLLARLTDEEVYHVFKPEWNLTLPGPNKFFIVRFLDRLARRGLVEESVIDKLKEEAYYCDKEVECFKGRYTNVDEAFMKENRHEDNAFYAYR
ncbi:hypothetical protein ASPSYDRAFT_93678 [Aspergillus sydowii CBS 593.65]|uniref:Uncharacterized protein n=1 Tax=Aspergillus sydowii CBS 593.65 TaxID=1036612 RepID=A0A1L9T5U8_9EURO|nr:uncharacterized protein ASPSYDRAFT_93678 [Aspergillus sydowii CBS 593.65]OJJ54777.1 hypothetical protein ASPSYDRAFT_93678 [Aspergillus sydowii CBS 593.65]